MKSLPQMMRDLWGTRAPLVVEEYTFIRRYPLLMSDLAAFCNAAGPIDGPNEFARGVEEGKRRVWLHIVRAADLRPEDFVAVANGENVSER